MGYKAALTLHRRGHYPRGGGRVTVSIDPLRILKGLGSPQRVGPGRVEGISHCVRLPSHVAERQAAAAKAKLNAEGISDVNVGIETYPPTQDMHVAPGSGITLAMKFANGLTLGADSIGERGKPAERVGEESANRLLTEFRSTCTVDRHMGDALIPYLAVAEGRSEIHVSEITTHILTNIKVAEILSDVNITVQGELHQPGSIIIQGIGLAT